MKNKNSVKKEIISKNKSLEPKILLSFSKEKDAKTRASLKPFESFGGEKKVHSLKNPDQKYELIKTISDLQQVSDQNEQVTMEPHSIEELNLTPLNYAEQQKQNRLQKLLKKNKRLLGYDKWTTSKEHNLTYIGVFLFTLVLYFRPYELIPGLSGFDMMAQIIAIATLLIYLLTQITIKASLTIFTTEVKCILIMVAFSILSILIAKDRIVAWEQFYGNFSKVALIFIVMLNVLQTKRRLQGLLWITIAISAWLSYQAVLLNQEGVFKTEGYRVSVDFGGMFGNPNAMAIHLAIYTPIAITLGLAAKNKLAKLIYFAVAALMVPGNLVTQSRGAFLGLVAMTAVLVWKLGRNQRLKSILISLIIGAGVIIIAPGNYGLRILSIVVPSLDPVGSSEERTTLLIQSIWVTLRNPLGIGMDNFSIVGIGNRETHNAFTQVSSEIGWIALGAYVILMVSPMRKLAAIERQMAAHGEFSWTYYMSIGVQASIVTYMVSSFFGSTAYGWYVYYLIAYAVCLRCIYQTTEVEDRSLIER